MSYKMLLNILILFLCTSCCACSDECINSEIVYLRVVDSSTGKNIIQGKTDNQVRVFGDFFAGSIIITGDATNPCLAFNHNLFNEQRQDFTIKIDNDSIGGLFIKTLRSKQGLCCTKVKISNFESLVPAIIITKKPEEEKQPFYEIQF